MTRLRLLAALLMLALCSCALAQVASQSGQSAAERGPVMSKPVPPRLFSVYGTFERAAEGWRCKYAGIAPPELLRDLQVDDVLVAINGADLVKAGPIGLLQFLRLAEFDLAESADVMRAGQRMKFSAGHRMPQIIASQNSFTVLQSGVPQIQQGDVLTALNQTTFAAMLRTVTNPLTSVVNIELRQGKTLHLTRNARPADITIDRNTMLRLVRFEVNSAQEPPLEAELHALNGRNAALSAHRGKWVLLHLWATWCAPCIRHMPDIRELAQRTDLFVAAIGFADTEERLRAAASTEKSLKVFAPHMALERELAITAIPFDALIDPSGRVSMVVAGDMPGEQFKDLVSQYLQH